MRYQLYAIISTGITKLFCLTQNRGFVRCSISTAVLISSINIDVVVNGALSLSEAISFYNLTMPLVMFIIIAVVGFAIGVWGLVEKDK